MPEVCRRILVVIMAIAGASIGLWCLITGGAIVAVGLGLIGNDPLTTKETIQHVGGGLALITIPNAALVYIANGYFKKS